VFKDWKLSGAHQPSVDGNKEMFDKVVRAAFQDITCSGQHADQPGIWEKFHKICDTAKKVDERRGGRAARRGATVLQRIRGDVRRAYLCGRLGGYLSMGEGR
jgi:hypothetical protein